MTSAVPHSVGHQIFEKSAPTTASTRRFFRRRALLVLIPFALAQLSGAQSVISTIAGTGSIGFGGDGEPATAATLGLPNGVAVDGAGNVYIADSLNRRIRKVNAATGVISTVAGNGFPFYAGDGGPATSASISLCGTAPHSGIALDQQGNLYIADCANNRIRKVDTAGIISTIAGVGGTTALSGDGGPAISAHLGFPYGIAVDANGNIYIADTGNGRIRKIDASTGIITTVAGTTQGSNLGDGGLAINAQLANPHDVAVDNAGNLYISDYGNGRVRKVNTSGVITSLGISGIPGTDTVASLALDSAGNLYMTTGCGVVKLGSSGAPACYAGGGFNVPGDGGPATSAGLGTPSGVALDSFGNLYISDKSGSRIRKVTPPPTCVYALNAGGQAFPAAGGSATIALAAGSGCAWSALGAPAWITFSGASSGSGNGALNYTVAANSGAFRTATLTIGGVSFTVEQQPPTITGLAALGSLAQIASAGGWTTAFTYVNLGAAAAQARTSFFSNGGTALTLPFTFPQLAGKAGPLLASTFDRTLNPSASLLFSTTGAPSDSQMVGWGGLGSDGNIGGYAVFSFPALMWNAVVPLETRNAPSYLLAFDNTGSLATGVAIANLSAAPANINLVFRDDAGTQIDTETVTLAGHGHNSFILKTTYAATVDKRGTVEFDTPSGGQISVLGLRANGPALTTIPVLANVDGSGGSLTHATFNGGFNTLFTLVNTGSASAQATLNFFDDNGAALPMQLVLPQTSTQLNASTVTRTLAAGASLLVQAQGQAALPSVVGSAQLTATGNVSGFAIFNWTTFGQEASVPLETRNPSAFVLAFDNTNGIVTGVAVANVSAQAATIPVTIRDDTGAVLGNANIQLAGNGHTSFLLGDKYFVVNGKRGTVEFGSPGGGRISVVGLRAKSDGSLTTIPVLSH